MAPTLVPIEVETEIYKIDKIKQCFTFR